MQSSLYTASHRADFEVFLNLVDDTAVQTAALLNVTSWHGVRSLWYFMGTDPQWLLKLLDLLSPQGMACLVLPNTASIFVDFTRSFSPDTQMTLVGDEVVHALEPLDCTVTRQTGTKWLARQDVFEGDALSKASLAFAAFVAMRPVSTLTEKDKAHMTQLLTAKQREQGVPLIWDLVCVTR